MSVLSDLAGRVPRSNRAPFKLVNLLLAAALVGLGGAAYAATRTKTAATVATVRTAPVARGVVLSSVSATGSIASPSDLSVGFDASGIVSDIAVKAGQRVAKGEVLARIDDTTARSAVAQAQASLASAQANLTAARAGETTAQRRADAVSVAQAAASVRQANVAVTTARAQLKSDDASAAQALRQAQSTASLRQAQTQQRADRGNEKAAVAKQTADVAKLTIGGTTYATVDQALNAIDAVVAQDKLTVQSATQSNYDLQLRQTQDQQRLSADQTTLSRATSTSAKKSAQSQVDSDQSDVNADAVALQQQAKQMNTLQYQLTQDEATQQTVQTLQTTLEQDATSIQSYEAKLVSDRNAIQSATSLRTTAIQSALSNRATTVAKDQQAIASAEQQVASAKLSVEATNASNAAKAVVSPSTIAQDEASIIQVQATLAAAERTLQQTVLTAPAAGTVAAVNGVVGGSVSGTGTTVVASSSSSSSSSSSTGSATASGLVQLVKVGGLQVTATFSESDAAKLRVGQSGTVTVSALPNVELPAHVIAVDVLGSNSSGVVDYTVTLALDRAAAALKPGMSASVSITTAEKDGVLNVPSAAVTGSGANASVRVMRNGVSTTVPVVAGLKGDSTTQIVSGLTAGEDIVVSTVTAASTGTGTSTSSPASSRFGGGLGGLTGGGAPVGGRGFGGG